MHTNPVNHLHTVLAYILTQWPDCKNAFRCNLFSFFPSFFNDCLPFSFRTGGIVPPVAQQLHRENIERIVDEALSASRISPRVLSAIATTVKPGLALSLGVGLSFSLQLVNQFKKPFIPIHHMEAHALTIRLTNKVEFPFLVLLISGGHCLLALVRGVSDFLLLGKSLDIAPGDMLDKVARRLSLIKRPEYSTMSGGKAIEHLATEGNRFHLTLNPPMQNAKNCNFSFTGLQHVIDKLIQQKEKEEGIEKGQILSSAADIAAAVQHVTACHLARRTHRAILFCKQRELLPPANAVLVSFARSPASSGSLPSVSLWI
ncbi:tRNA N6-adenosine threonylcarbamoyltransferase, mitochondrial [Lemmus lemmus]